jgi:predicted dehydrogenase
VVKFIHIRGGMIMIRIGIYGYGNLGKGAEAAIKKNSDMELVAVFTRRNPKDLTIATPTILKSFILSW